MAAPAAPDGTADRPVVLLLVREQAVLSSDVLDLPPSPAVRIVRAEGDHDIASAEPDLIATLLLERLDTHPDIEGALS